jgi:hypothetical protein
MNLREIFGLEESEPNDSELSVSPPSDAVSGIYQIRFPRARKLESPDLQLYMALAGRCEYTAEVEHPILDIDVDWEDG